MRKHGLVRALTVVAAAAALGGLLAGSARAAANSSNVALVPNAYGYYYQGGVLPMTGYPGGYAPTFANVTPESIRDDATNPLTGYDTVVLNGICNIGDFLANAQFKSRIESFAYSGGKVIIYDSECWSTDYTNFVFPFTTSNPGAAGATGTLTISENNTLGNGTSGDPSFLDVGLISTQTDAVGDANVFTSFDQNWCGHMQATNILGVNGPATAYAHYGSGLIVYDGLDKDYMDSSYGYDVLSGMSNLNRTFMLQLLQPFGPDNLPCGVKVFGLSLTPKTATNNVGTSHTVTAHLTTNALPAVGEAVTFTVLSGPNTSVTGTGTTDSNGDAAFTYTGTGGAGTDTIEASATLPGTGGLPTTVTDTATKTWTAVGTACPANVKVKARWHVSAPGKPGPWSQAKHTRCTDGSVTIKHKGIGDLKLAPGSTINLGYAFKLQNNKLPFTAQVSNPTVGLQLSCVSKAVVASPSTLTVSLATQTYSVTGHKWVPSKSKTDPLAYQGSGTIPDACNGGMVRLDKGSMFSAMILLY